MVSTKGTVDIDVEYLALKLEGTVFDEKLAH
jgi:hypothetical protein